MAAFRHLHRLIPRSSSLTCAHCHRAFSAAALAVAHYDHWELPLPMLQDTQGQRSGRGPQWIFLGSPGVGRATYASRLARILNVPHISMGDLLRKEVTISTSFSNEIARVIMQGQLVPDDLIFSILSKRLEHGVDFGESGFILEGFPRTTNQAEVLDEVADIDLVVNLKTTKCPATPALSEMVCRENDDAEIMRQRLQAYSAQIKPVEYHYRMKGKLLDFEVLGGIPQTWPRLVSALQLEDKEVIMQQQLPV